MLFLYSIRSSAEIFSVNVTFLPREPTFEAIMNSLTYKIGTASFLNWAPNSFITAGISALLATYMAALGGYGFVRYNFPGRRVFFFMIFLTQVLPWIVLLIPYYSLLLRFGLLDTLLGLGFSYLIIIVPISTWLFIGFFRNQPRALEEAARIDGCSAFGVFHRIALPLSMPALSAILLFVFVIGWGDFLFASVILKSPTQWTLPVGLQSFEGEHTVKWAEMLSLATIMTLPIVVFFLITQRYMVNLMAGSIKE
jgi:ABC-type glycerol-3-phosphate transport system permease component